MRTHYRTGTRLILSVVLFCVLGISYAAIAQDDLIQEAEALDEEVSRLHSEGRDSEAIPAAQKVLAITEKVLGSEHPDTATALNKLAELYQDTRSYAKADPLFQRALAIREKIFGLEHPATAESFSKLISLYAAMGAYAKAEPLLQRVLAFLEKILGPEDPTTALWLNNLGELYRTIGAYAKAEPLLQRALAIREKVLGSEDPLTAAVINNLALLYEGKGAYTKAEPLLQRALAIQEKTLGLGHPDTATMLDNLGELYHTIGAYAKAEPLLQRALAIREKVLGPDNPDVAMSVNNLATHYFDTGAYAKAEPLLQRALAIREKVLGPEHPLTALSVGNLASLYGAMGAYAKAEPLLQRALAIREKVLGPDNPDVAMSVNNLATHYFDTGAYSKAESLLKRALARWEKVLGLEHPNTALALNNLGELYRTIGAYVKAEPLLQRALAIREKVLGPEHPLTALSVSNLAVLHWTNGDLTRARLLVSRTTAIAEKNVSTFLLTGSESRRQNYLVQGIGTTFQSVSLSLLMPDRQAKALGLQSVLTTKGRVLDAMSESTARFRMSEKPEDRAILEELTAVVQKRSTLTYQGISNFEPEVYRQRLQELDARQEQLEADLSARSAEFRQVVAPITLAAVQAAIPRDAAFIEWYRYNPFNPKAKDQRSRLGNPRYVAYVLKREAEPVVVDVGWAEPIEQLVSEFRTGLKDPRNALVRDLARDLYDHLIKPLRPHLGDPAHLLMSPDSVLNKVPFAALVDETGAYLATKWGITYLTSGRDLLRVSAPSVIKNNTVIVANPDFGRATPAVAQVQSSAQPTRSADLDRGGMDFPSLPGTAEEAKVLKKLLKVTDGHLLTQTNATETRVKQIRGPKILHVATHGFFLKDHELPAAARKPVSFLQDQVAGPIGENPLLRSGLALAGANQRQSGEKDDGILTAAEVAQMDLHGTQLVVLSACETGVGDVLNGEGVYGLRRALVLAGAETQVTSLWKVADDATKDLMVDYYKRLLKGEGRSVALRNAQLTMMKSKDRSHPYYWAAFVPIGNWAPLVQSKEKE